MSWSLVSITQSNILIKKDINSNQIYFDFSTGLWLDRALKHLSYLDELQKNANMQLDSLTRINNRNRDLLNSYLSDIRKQDDLLKIQDLQIRVKNDRIVFTDSLNMVYSIKNSMLLQQSRGKDDVIQLKNKTIRKKDWIIGGLLSVIGFFLKFG